MVRIFSSSTGVCCKSHGANESGRRINIMKSRVREMIKYWSLHVLFVVFLRSQNGIFFFYISVISAYKQAEFAENVNSKVSI